MLWFFPLTPSVCGDDYLTFPVMVDELSIMKYYREERDNEIDERERWRVWMVFIEWDGRSPLRCPKATRPWEGGVLESRLIDEIGNDDLQPPRSQPQFRAPTFPCA